MKVQNSQRVTYYEGGMRGTPFRYYPSLLLALLFSFFFLTIFLYLGTF